MTNKNILDSKRLYDETFITMIRADFRDKLFQTIIVILTEITCIHKINPIIYYSSVNGEKLIYRN